MSSDDIEMSQELELAVRPRGSVSLESNAMDYDNFICVSRGHVGTDHLLSSIARVKQNALNHRQALLEPMRVSNWTIWLRKCLSTPPTQKRLAWLWWMETKLRNSTLNQRINAS